MRLDYSIDTQPARLEEVRRVVREARHLSARDLTSLADYLLFVSDARQTKAERAHPRPIVTRNRAVTFAKRDMSLDGAIDSLAGGEGSLLAMSCDGRGLPLDAKAPISQADMDVVPGLRECAETIGTLKAALAREDCPNRSALTRQVISTYKEMYAIRGSYGIARAKARVGSQIRQVAHMRLDESVTVGPDGLPRTTGIVSLLRADHVSFLLRYRERLEAEVADDLDADMHWLLIDLDELTKRALAPYPLLMDLMEWETRGYQGSEIVRLMERDHGISHTEQYFSTLWRKRIPRLVAACAQRRWLLWHYTYEAPDEAEWKVCTQCGRRLPANPMFFHRNTSKDGYYSMCRDCRSKREVS